MRIKSPLKFCIFLICILLTVSGGYYIAAKYLGFSQMQFGIFSNISAFGKNNVQNFVIAGVDEDGTRTDLIMVAQYNPKEKKINVLQIPRDLKVNTQRYDKKINSAYGTKEGTAELCKDLNGVLGIDIDKYVIVSFKGFREIIDAIGGVEIDVPIRMDYKDPAQHLVIDIKKGRQTLNGKQAEMFMRFRQNSDGSGYAEGDIGRVKAQQQFYSAVMDKLFSPGTIIQVPKLLGIVMENVKTNLTSDEMLKYIGVGLKMNKDSVNIMQLPGHGSEPNEPISYFYNDKQKTEEIIAQYFTPGSGDSANNKEDDKKVNTAKNKAIKVQVINAGGIPTDKLDLGNSVAETLKENGFNVINVVNQDKKIDKTNIIDHNKKLASIEILKVFSGLPVSADNDKSSGCDVTLVIGADFSY